MTHSQCSRTALFVCVLSDHQLLSVPLTCMASGLHVLQHNCYMKSFMVNKAIYLETLHGWKSMHDLLSECGVSIVHQKD